MSTSPVENVLLKDYVTFRMGGIARYLISIVDPYDIPEALAFAQKRGLPVVILGGGSNMVIDDSGILQVVVIKIEIPGLSLSEEGSQNPILHIGAGVVWDDAVRYAVNRGLAGIEAMSAIPGTAGATPIQNVGAYGQEIKDTLLSVQAYDRQTASFVMLSPAECRFGYRDSMFRHSGRDRYIITSIALKLSRRAPRIPDYPGVREYCEQKGITLPSLRDIRDAIIAIRAEKLPDPSVLASVGSFFKNPVVPQEVADHIKEKYPKVAVYDLGNGTAKVGAGSLIDALGFKGIRVGDLGTYAKNALVIVNYGNGSFAELEAFKALIATKVREATGITLEQEPVEIR